MQGKNEKAEGSMPPAISFVLTHRLPCAITMLAMFMAAVWIPALFQGLPFVAMVGAMLGMGLHLLTPALIALITIGGGIAFSLQVAALASIGVAAIADFQLLPGIMVFLLYGVTPALAALALMQEDGVRRSAQLLAVVVGGTVLIGLFIAAASQGIGARELIEQMLTPMFQGIEQQVPTSEVEGRIMLTEAQQAMASMLPGLAALSIWLVWWGNTLLARNSAHRYKFFSGEMGSMLDLRLDKAVAYAFATLTLLGNLGSSDIHYLAINAAILVGGMLAMQGIAVAHSWLKAKGMNLSIVLMYIMLMIWSVMIIPFVILGLIDIWFDYRRNIPAAGG